MIAPALAALAVAAASGQPTSVAAGSDPSKTVQAAALELRAALAAPDPRAALTRVTDTYVDYEELARRSLGRLWAKQQRGDRERVVQALRATILETYLSRLRPGSATSFTVEQITRRGLIARARASAGSGADQVPLELRLYRARDGRWRVFDAAVAGIGLLDGYEQQLPQLFQIGGTKKIVEVLDEQRAAAARRE